MASKRYRIVKKRYLKNRKEPKLEKKVVSLDVSNGLNGNISIKDHPNIDIFISQRESKIFTMPKKIPVSDATRSQECLMDHLRRNGSIIFDSVQGGNIHGVLEAKIVTESEFEFPIQILILDIHDWLSEDVKKKEFVKKFNADIKHTYTEPSAEDSTELGKTPPRVKKKKESYYEPTYGYMGYGYGAAW